MSEHKIEIVEVGNVWPHPNADKLELTNIWGWQIVIGKGNFTKGDKAIYIPPDYIVPTCTPEFEFLKREGRIHERITVKRLRGELSQGLLIPVPDRLSEFVVGTNVIKYLQIERYEAPVKGMPGFQSGPPIGSIKGPIAPKFDVENYQRYNRLFEEGEPVVITEKIHGANARFVMVDGVQYCGSRNNWWEYSQENLWWRALEQNPSIVDFCRTNPTSVLYGEVFGQVQDLKYGAGTNKLFFAAFAILEGGIWISAQQFFEMLDESKVQCVPLVYEGPFSATKLYELAEGNSMWPRANHIREGVVVMPEIERTDSRIGRVCLKCVSNKYLEKSYK